MTVHVIPTKSGMWRVVHVTDSLDVIEGAVRLSTEMHRRWERAYAEWFARKGCRLAISLEMWVE